MILITGDRGYIGTNLTKFLVEQGFEVKGYDVLNGKCILDKELLMKELEGCSHVFHCAAVSGIKACDENPKFAYNVNVEGTTNVIFSATMLNVHPIIFSSRAVYGDTYYGELKRFIEGYADKSVVLRLSNVYGGDNYFEAKPNNVLSRFARDNPLIVYGGTQTRDFVHISQVLDTCLNALDYPFKVYDVCSEYDIPIGSLARLVSTLRNVSIEYLPSRE